MRMFLVGGTANKWSCTWVSCCSRFLRVERVEHVLTPMVLAALWNLWVRVAHTLMYLCLVLARAVVQNSLMEMAELIDCFPSDD